MKYTEESDKVSYSLGLSIASNLIASGVRTINTPAFIDAIETAYAGKQPEMLVWPIPAKTSYISPFSSSSHANSLSRLALVPTYPPM